MRRAEESSVLLIGHHQLGRSLERGRGTRRRAATDGSKNGKHLNYRTMTSNMQSPEKSIIEVSKGLSAAAWRPPASLWNLRSPS